MKVVISEVTAERLETLRKMEAIQSTPIPFFTDAMRKGKKKKKDTSDETEEGEQKDKYKEFELFIHPGNDSSPSVKQKVLKYGNAPTPESWCKHRMIMEEEIFPGLGIQGDTSEDSDEESDENANSRYYTLLHTLEGEVKKEFVKAHSTRHAENTARAARQQVSFRQLLKLITNDVAKSIFKEPETAYKRQVRYLRNSIFVGDLKWDVFRHRLEDINAYLKYFPKYEGLEVIELPESELIDIIDKAAPLRWISLMTNRGKVIQSFNDYTELKTYIESIEKALEVQEIVENNTKDLKRTRDGEKKRTPGKHHGQHKKSVPKCTHCDKLGHKSQDCWTLDKNKSKRPKSYGNYNDSVRKAKKEAFAAVRKYKKVQAKKSSKKTKEQSKEKEISDDEINEDEALMAKLNAGLTIGSDDSDSKSKRRKLNNYGQQTHTDVKTQVTRAMTQINRRKRQWVVKDNEKHKPTEEAFPFHVNRTQHNNEPKKKQKNEHYSAEIIVEIVNRHGETVPIRALLDTGTSSTIVLRDFVKKGRAKSYKGKTYNLVHNGRTI